jgi:hypothetical protein
MPHLIQEKLNLNYITYTAQERFRLLQEMELNPDRWFRWDKVVKVQVRQGSGGDRFRGEKGPGGPESRWVRVQMGHD